MEEEQPFSCLLADVEPVLGHDARKPGRFAGPFEVVDLRFPATRVHDHEPDQPSPHDEPDDQQPDVEFSVHRRPV
jgi:hypothetical protein